MRKRVMLLLCIPGKMCVMYIRKACSLSDSEANKSHEKFTLRYHCPLTELLSVLYIQYEKLENVSVATWDTITLYVENIRNYITYKFIE